jgi:hypothetical protein
MLDLGRECRRVAPEENFIPTGSLEGMRWRNAIVGESYKYDKDMSQKIPF